MWVENGTAETGTAMSPRGADAWRRADDVWREFVSASVTLGPTPGERERWHRGRARYAVWVLRIDAPAVVERVQELQRILGERLRPVPSSDLHVTVHVAGFPAASPRLDDDVAKHVLDEQAAAVQGCLGRPLRIGVGGSNAFLSAAILDVFDPEGDVALLKRRLATRAPELRFGPYHPHVTAGCFTASRPTAAIARELAGLRDPEPVELEVGVEAIELVELDAAVDGAHLETRRRVSLVAGAVS